MSAVCVSFRAPWLVVGRRRDEILEISMSSTQFYLQTNRNQWSIKKLLLSICAWYYQHLIRFMRIKTTLVMSNALSNAIRTSLSMHLKRLIWFDLIQCLVVWGISIESSESSVDYIVVFIRLIAKAKSTFTIQWNSIIAWDARECERDKAKQSKAKIKSMKRFIRPL